MKSALVSAEDVFDSITLSDVNGLQWSLRWSAQKTGSTRSPWSTGSSFNEVCAGQRRRPEHLSVIAPTGQGLQ